MVSQSIKDTMERELLRYAVSRSIFCPACETVLDVSTAVLWSPVDLSTARVFILCGDCNDRMVETASPVESAAIMARYETTDGRTL